MPGANYMGGRRNAAKARARDVDGRLQKNHFGRQRLAILGRGLGKVLTPDRISRSHESVPPMNISFAHARRNFEDSDAPFKTPVDTTFCVYTGSPRSPPGKRQKLDSNLQSQRNRSAVLNEVDTSEPACMKAAIARLLEQPDFAGLSRTSRKTARNSDPSVRRDTAVAMNCNIFSERADEQHLARPRIPCRSQQAGSRSSSTDACPPFDTPGTYSSMQEDDTPPAWSTDDDFEIVSFDDENDDVDDSTCTKSADVFDYFVQDRQLGSPGFDFSVVSPDSHLESYVKCHDPLRFLIGSSSPSVDPPANSRHHSPCSTVSLGFAHLHEGPGHRQKSTPSPLLVEKATCLPECSPRSPLSTSRQHLSSSPEPRRQRFSIDFDAAIRIPRPQSQSSGHAVTQETLADLVDGHLFEDADLLRVIRNRLGLEWQPATDPDEEGTLLPTLVEMPRTVHMDAGFVCTTESAPVDPSLVHPRAITYHSGTTSTPMEIDPERRNSPAEDDNDDYVITDYFLPMEPGSHSTAIEYRQESSPADSPGASMNDLEREASGLTNALTHSGIDEEIDIRSEHLRLLLPPETRTNMFAAIDDSPIAGAAMNAEEFVEPLMVKDIAGPALFATDEGSDD